MEVIDNEVKNLYVIKRRLADLKTLQYGGFEYHVGDFVVKIYTQPFKGMNTIDKNDCIVKHEKVNVLLNELNKRNGFYERVNLENDPRFSNYEPIKYDDWNGDNMPILQLCELIKYLHRLSKLTIFA
jgi:hypothetical protein